MSGDKWLIMQLTGHIIPIQLADKARIATQTGMRLCNSLASLPVHDWQVHIQTSYASQYLRIPLLSTIYACNSWWPKALSH